MHVIQAKGIGRKTGHRCGERITVIARQCVVGKRRPQRFCLGVEHVGNPGQACRVVAVVVAGARAGAGGVLPLSFGGQAVDPAFGCAEPARQGLGIVPGHVDHRVCVGLRKAWVAPAVARVAAIKLLAACALAGHVLRVVAITAGAIGN